MVAAYTPSEILANRQDLRRFYQLVSLRSVLAVSLVIFAASTADIGTDKYLLAASALSGVLLAPFLLLRRFSFSKVVISHAVILAGVWVIIQAANIYLSGNPNNPRGDFEAYIFATHFWLLAAIYLVALVSTWAFWCFAHTVTFEATIFTLSFVWILAGHRHYQLDAPKKVGSLAWEWGIAPQHFLLAGGASFAALLALYFILGHARPLFSARAPVRSYGPAQKLALVSAPLLFLALLASYAFYINRNYSENISRATNGVGQETKEGQSPLGFHSATGKTKQPAALVRLEGDYEKNPWTPMLYFREGALSSFAGRELVIADNRYDTDVPRVAPGQPYVKMEEPENPWRHELTQSVYLLAKHTAPFAVDYPRTFRLIKNPDQDRFELAYQAVSIAPTVALNTLIGEETGDERWDKDTWAHYLRAPGSLSLETGKDPDEGVLNTDGAALDDHKEDLRYRAFLKKYFSLEDPPVLLASKISNFLSQASIYTRNPGHQVQANGDPVAPYLFSEKKRGYCVHFAHAAVYLMRLAGIPARIATGYLTDLTYAKDGHILLHLGDRHAWPEIYVRGLGWTVADISPAEAENEQVIVPDEKLLEELMSKVDPAEELVTPPPPSPDETEGEESIIERVVRKEVIIPLMVMCIAVFIALKTWLRFGYLLPVGGPRRVHLAYLSFASAMADVGLGRNYGETRREYATRLHAERGIDAGGITMLGEQNRYSKSFGGSSLTALRQALLAYKHALRRPRERAKRCLGFLNPHSLLRLWKL